MRLRVGPLPASQVVTAALICTGRTIGIRTCGGAGQIARLRLLPRAWRLAIGVCMVRRRQGLPVGAVHGRGRANASPDGVCGDEGLRLRRDGREDAVLVESQAVGAPAVLGGLEAGAADLGRVSKSRSRTCAVGGRTGDILPCGDGSSGRQWQCAGAGRAAGGAAAGHTVEAGLAGGTGRAAAGRASTRWGLAGGTAAGTAGAGGRPCQGAALGVEEEGGSCSSGAGNVSGRRTAYVMAAWQAVYSSRAGAGRRGLDAVRGRSRCTRGVLTGSSRHSHA